MTRLVRLVLFSIAILCAFVFWQVSFFPQALKEEPLGPSFFPILLSCCILTLLARLCFENRGKKEDASFALSLKNFLVPSFFAGSAFVFALALHLVGFLICSLIFLFTGMLVCGVALRKAILGTLLITAGVYSVFKMLLQVALPVGTLWENFL
jgi:hypothetical protein